MPWYGQIHRECFARDDATFYLIHPKRGYEAQKISFTGAFERVLVIDFWRAYVQTEVLTNLPENTASGD